jgi:hypothetical protein
MKNDLIKTISDGYVGQQENDLRNNSGFKDESFQKKLETCGWTLGQAWCSYFAEMVWKEAYQDDQKTWNLLDKLFDAGAIKTWHNFKDSGLFVCSEKPAIGSVTIWQHYHNYQPTWMGHAGILVDYSLLNKTILNNEGNTSFQGSREGFIVEPQEREFNFEPVKKGLVLIGFIQSL